MSRRASFAGGRQRLPRRKITTMDGLAKAANGSQEEMLDGQY